jgi:hypothetical protein
MKRLRQRSTILRDTDNAVASIVVAILLIGLAFTTISTIQVFYIPKWMEQEEAKHMDEVADQFAQLKLVIDMQLLAEKEDTPLSTSITLGSKELPILMSERAFGFLEISDGNTVITIDDDNDPTTLFSYPVGIITYSSSNAYFLDQSYIYESGAVILSQSQDNIMCMLPSFSASKTGSNVDMSFTIIDVAGVGEKTSAGGYGTYPIRTDFSNIDSRPITDVTNITITTNYQNAWHIFLNSTLNASRLNYGTDNDYWILETDTGVIVEFSDSLTVDLEVDNIVIEAQIAPGWIE